MQVFVFGYPSSYGGADTELWHVMRLWKRFGVDVHLLTTQRPDPAWRRRCTDHGFLTHRIGGPNWQKQVDGISNAPVVSFCNAEFFQRAIQFRELGCKLIWVNCMTYVTDAEKDLTRKIGPFDRYVFQSEFQQDCILRALSDLGVEKRHAWLVRGSLDASEFPFSPREHGSREPFVVGRLARSDPDKWHRSTWSVFSKIGYRPIEARAMAWSPTVERKLGTPPVWATTLAACEESSLEFYRQIHALLALNGGARENWSRIGLEAMSAGVPVIAHDAWGWKEMIVHGESGFLAESPEEFAAHATTIANDEPLRRHIIQNARARLVEELANPKRIWSAWEQLFESVTT